MRISAGLLLLCVAGPVLGAETLSFDFRGGRFDSEALRFVGPTPDTFIKRETEGLRLSYTGAGAPPTNTPSGVAWRYQVRGDFVCTARYEILKCEPPSKGTFFAGVELYLQLDNLNFDAVAVARGVYPNGSAALNFKVLTKGAMDKQFAKDFKRANTTDTSLRGRLRLARTGSIVTGSIAEGNEGPFTEFQRSEIGNADIRLVRVAAIAGGDAQAVLDMRILDFELEGEALSLNGPFVTPLPKTVIPKATADAPNPLSDDAASPGADQLPANKHSALLWTVVFFVFVIGVPVVVSIVLLALRRKAAIAIANQPAGRKGAGKERTS